jgi:hypothetical protein
MGERVRTHHHTLHCQLDRFGPGPGSSLTQETEIDLFDNMSSLLAFLKHGGHRSSLISSVLPTVRLIDKEERETTGILLNQLRGYF